MDVVAKNIVVTGAASGIGEGLVTRFCTLGAAHVIVADLSVDRTHTVTAALQAQGGTASDFICDVSDQESVTALVETAIERMGHIDLFCSNAGVGAGSGLHSTDAEWELSLGVNTLAHVYAARSVVPHMVERGGGYLLNTVSGAGMITGPTPFPYAVSKHAALGVAEWLQLHFGQTITIMTLNPTVVDTPMIANFGELLMTPLTVEEVVDATIQGLEAETFLICPNPVSLEQFRAKANDADAFLAELGPRVRRLDKF